MNDVIEVSDTLFYQKGFKYQTQADFTCHIEVFPNAPIKTEFIILTMQGILRIKKGYAWDGASGPTIDTSNTMRGSLIHDALYQLMRQKLLQKYWRASADVELYKWILKDGMSKIRAYWWHRGVKKCAAKAADPASLRKTYRIA